MNNFFFLMNHERKEVNNSAEAIINFSNRKNMPRPRIKISSKKKNVYLVNDANRMMKGTFTVDLKYTTTDDDDKDSRNQFTSKLFCMLRFAIYSPVSLKNIPKNMSIIADDNRRKKLDGILHGISDHLLEKFFHFVFILF